MYHNNNEHYSKRVSRSASEFMTKLASAETEKLTFFFDKLFKDITQTYRNTFVKENNIIIVLTDLENNSDIHVL